MCLNEVEGGMPPAAVATFHPPNLYAHSSIVQIGTSPTENEHQQKNKSSIIAASAITTIRIVFLVDYAESHSFLSLALAHDRFAIHLIQRQNPGHSSCQLYETADLLENKDGKGDV